MRRVLACLVLIASPAPAQGPPAHLAQGQLDWLVHEGAWEAELQITPRGEGVMAYDVWLGAHDETLKRVVRGMPTLSYAPLDLLGGQTYMWRVDGSHLGGKTIGDVWSFTVDDSGLPQTAVAPYPRHLASGVSMPRGAALQWVAGQGAVEHDVYFGTEFPLPLRGRQTGQAFVPGPLELDRTYYWRIDAVNESGVRTGFTWRFDTKR